MSMEVEYEGKTADARGAFESKSSDVEPEREAYVGGGNEVEEAKDEWDGNVIEPGASSVVTKDKANVDWDTERKDEEVAITIHQSIFGQDALVQRLVEFWGSEAAYEVHDFLDKHASKFRKLEQNPDMEHDLEYTRLHKVYEDLVERHLVNFRNTESISSKDLFNRLKAAGNENRLASTVIQLVLSCSEYHCFVDCMKMKAEEQRMAEQVESRVDDDETKNWIGARLC